MTTWQDFYQTLDKRASSAALIIEDTDGRLLVVKAHYKPYWSLPGGWVDAGETPREAALREVNEEIGLSFEPAQLRFDSFIERGSERGLTHLFVFRLKTQILTETRITLEKAEIAEYDWVSTDDIRSNCYGRHYNRAPKNWASDNPSNYLESVV